MAPQAEADPTHSKSINYEGVRTIIQAAQASGTCGRVVRITGKGETPWSVLSILTFACPGPDPNPDPSPDPNPNPDPNPDPDQVDLLHSDQRAGLDGEGVELVSK